MTAVVHDDAVTRGPSERTGVLVLRIWTEDSQVDVLRARISSTTELGSIPPSTAVAGPLDDVRALVAAFLKAFAVTRSP